MLRQRNIFRDAWVMIDSTYRPRQPLCQRPAPRRVVYPYGREVVASDGPHLGKRRAARSDAFPPDLPFCLPVKQQNKCVNALSTHISRFMLDFSSVKIYLFCRFSSNQPFYEALNFCRIHCFMKTFVKRIL